MDTDIPTTNPGIMAGDGITTGTETTGGIATAITTGHGTVGNGTIEGGTDRTTEITETPALSMLRS